MPLGDELGADDEVVIAAGDLGEALADLGNAAHVGGKDHAARIWKELRGFLGDALDARPDGGQGIFGAAIGAARRGALLVSAVMAGKHAAKAMLDKPG